MSMINTILAFLFALAVLVFVPIRFLYPSRTPVWPVLTNGLGAVWGASVLAIVWLQPQPPRWLVIVSLAYPALYTALSLWLEIDRRATQPAPAERNEA